jgi:hypothetical protein
VRTTGEVAQLALTQGEASARPILQAKLQPPRAAAQLDPLAIGVPLTMGSHYLLLGNGTAAELRARARDPAASGDLLQSGAGAALPRPSRRSVARAETAVTLDPRFEDEAVALGFRD